MSFAGYINELRHDSPRLSYTCTYILEVPGVSYMSYQGIKQDNLHKDACLPDVSYIFLANLHMFSGGELRVWASDELARDLSDACKTTIPT